MPKKIRLTTHEKKLLCSHPAAIFSFGTDPQTAKENPPVSASFEVLWFEKIKRQSGGNICN
jgi:hypothetical protein